MFTDADREIAREGIDEMRPLVNDLCRQFLVYMDHFAGDEERAFAALVGYVNDRLIAEDYDRNVVIGMLAFMARRLHYHTPLLAQGTPN